MRVSSVSREGRHSFNPRKGYILAHGLMLCYLLTIHVSQLCNEGGAHSCESVA